LKVKPKMLDLRFNPHVIPVIPAGAFDIGMWCSVVVVIVLDYIEIALMLRMERAACGVQ
jgi:hypothetical protein